MQATAGREFRQYSFIIISYIRFPIIYVMLNRHTANTQDKKKIWLGFRESTKVV